MVKRVLRGEKLSFDDALKLFEDMFEGRLLPEQTAAILAVMAFRGETPEEVAAAITVAEKKKIKVEHAVDGVVDTCGTGGDGAGTFNISTASALVLRSLGVPVAKHGNRAVTGVAGSADIVEALGLKVAGNAEEAKKELEEKRFTFLFAPGFHPAFAKVAPVRKALGVPTIFNILGPQINPCDPSSQLVGVYSVEKARVVAEANRLLGRRNRVFVSSTDGLDEVSPKAETVVIEVRDGSVKEYTFDPQKLLGRYFDVPRVSTKEQALKVFEEALSYKNEEASLCVALNTAFALYAAGVCDVDEGFKRALSAIKDGAVLEMLKELKDVS